MNDRLKRKESQLISILLSSLYPYPHLDPTEYKIYIFLKVLNSANVSWVSSDKGGRLPLESFC